MHNTTCLQMDSNSAEEAIRFYTYLFPSLRLDRITRYLDYTPGKFGSTVQVVFTLDGTKKITINGNQNIQNANRDPIYVKCTTEPEITEIYNQLTDEGTIMIPLDRYAYNRKFAWVRDKYGVTWLLDLLQSSN